MDGDPLRSRGAGPALEAPDRMLVRPYDLRPARNLALAEGRIEPGATYGVHAHRTIEQVTYVLAGRVRATCFDPFRGGPASVELGVGEAVVTQPGESVQFACLGSGVARVLFVTSPPYPVDHADTVVLDRHRRLRPGE